MIIRNLTVSCQQLNLVFSWLGLWVRDTQMGGAGDLDK